MSLFYPIRYTFMRIKLRQNYNFMRIKTRKNYNFMRITAKIIILQHPERRTDRHRQDHFNPLDYEKILLALGKQRNCAVSILDDAIGEQRAKGHHTVAIKHYKNCVWSRFGYQTD